MTTTKNCGFLSGSQLRWYCSRNPEQLWRRLSEADVKELLLELISQVSSLLEEEELGLPRATQVIKKAWRSLFCNIQIFEKKTFFNHHLLPAILKLPFADITTWTLSQKNDCDSDYHTDSCNHRFLHWLHQDDLIIFDTRKSSPCGWIPLSWRFNLSRTTSHSSSGGTFKQMLSRVVSKFWSLWRPNSVSSLNCEHAKFRKASIYHSLVVLTFLQARVEPFSTEVQLRPPEPEGPRRACALPAKERFLFQEGGTGGEGPQGAGAVVRGGQVQHAHIPLPLRDIRLHHAGRNPGLSHRDQLNWIEMCTLCRRGWRLDPTTWQFIPQHSFDRILWVDIQ